MPLRLTAAGTAIFRYPGERFSRGAFFQRTFRDPPGQLASDPFPMSFWDHSFSTPSFTCACPRKQSGVEPDASRGPRQELQSALAKNGRASVFRSLA